MSPRKSKEARRTYVEESGLMLTPEEEEELEYLEEELELLEKSGMLYELDPEDTLSKRRFRLINKKYGKSG